MGVTPPVSLLFGNSLQATQWSFWGPSISEYSVIQKGVDAKRVNWNQKSRKLVDDEISTFDKFLVNVHGNGLNQLPSYTSLKNTTINGVIGGAVTASEKQQTPVAVCRL